MDESSFIFSPRTNLEDHYLESKCFLLFLKYIDNVVLLVQIVTHFYIFVDVRAAKLARPHDMLTHVDAAVQARTQFVAQQNQRRQGRS